MQRTDLRQADAKTLVLLLDADGCIYNAHYRSLVEGQLDRYFPFSAKSHIENANPLFFLEVIKLCLTGKYNKIVIMCGSNRLCHDTDKYNARTKKTALFHLDLPTIQQILCDQLAINKLNHIEIISDFVLLADIESDLSYGSSQQRVIEAAADQTKKVYHATHAFDHSKLIWHYFVLHHVGCRYGAADIAYFDDTMPILERLLGVVRDFFIIPQKVSVAYYHYDGFNLGMLGEPLSGDATLDEDYHQNTRCMIKQYRESPLFKLTSNAVLCDVHHAFLESREKRALASVASTLFAQARTRMADSSQNSLDDVVEVLYEQALPSGENSYKA